MVKDPPMPLGMSLHLDPVFPSLSIAISVTHGIWPDFGSIPGVFLLNSNAMDVTLVSEESEAGGRLEYQLTGGGIDFFFFAGPSPMDVVRQYHSVIGTPVMPPLWSLGMHQCRWSVPPQAETQTSKAIPPILH